MDLNSELIKFWPTEDSLSQVCNKLGEVLPEAALLAVHEPMNFLAKTRSQINENDEKKLQRLTEHEVLDDFLHNKKDEELGFCFRIITGNSGTGKSHFINWVKAHLDRMQSPHHIVWIRKHHSLKKIFQLLFHPFNSDPEMKKLLEDIETAHSEISDERAGEIFKGGLEIALTDYQKARRDELISLKNNPEIFLQDIGINKDDISSEQFDEKVSELRKELNNRQHFAKELNH